MPDDNLHELYDESYYSEHCGDRAYDPDDPAWPHFFGSVADRIKADIDPANVLDVGCAFGFLVAALRERDVNASGFDFSSYAIEQAPRVADDLSDHVWVGSATEPIDGHFDLITCVEVIEHLPDSDGRTALRNMTDSCDRLLLSSTPLDFAEPTHLNVRPVEYWAEILAQLGFFRDHNVDTDFLTPWAGLFVRSEPDRRQLVRDYERTQALLSIERGTLRREHQRLALDQDDAAKQTLEGEVVRLTGQVEKLHDKVLDANEKQVAAEAEARSTAADIHLQLAEAEQIRKYQSEVVQRLGKLKAIETEAMALRQELAAIKSSTRWRVTSKLVAPYRLTRSILRRLS